MRGHNDQIAASGLCCFDNRSGRVRIRNMHEFYRYPDLLRHSSNFIQDLARTFLAGCVKAFILCLCGAPSRGVSASVIYQQRFRHGDDCCFSVHGLCQGKAMLFRTSGTDASLRIPGGGGANAKCHGVC